MTPICDIEDAPGHGTMGWLCPKCQEVLRAKGANVTDTGKVADRPCDDCPTKGRSPTPAYVIAPADAPIPLSPVRTPSKPMEPWTVYLKRKAAEMAAAKARAA